MTMFHWICKFTALRDIVIHFGEALLLSSCSNLNTTPDRKSQMSQCPYSQANPAV